VQLDRLELCVIPEHFVRWPDGGGFQPVEIRINQRPLIDLVREAELPFAQKELEERIADGQAPSQLFLLAGDYNYLPPSLVFRPCRNLLDEPWKHGFVLAEDDSRTGKATLLGCTCGVIECWFLQARVTISMEMVTWSDFGQFHRDWDLQLGPFSFERLQYELQLAQQY
jgi:hypothetical protein